MNNERQTAQSVLRLFSSSGIRGIVGEDLSEELCLDVARAIGSTLPPHSKVCIATDTRVSREVISNAVTTGFRTTGLIDKQAFSPITPEKSAYKAAIF
jgi:phosphomannomutase